MIILLAILVGYALPLILYKSEPDSLKEKAQTVPMGKRFISSKGTLGLGFVLILIYFFTSAGEWKDSTPLMIDLFGESKSPVFFYFQLLTCNFVHVNYIHLLGNLIALWLLSAYERKRGTKRYFVVFVASGLFSAVGSYPFLASDTVYLGASAGICGLVAAYFTDIEDLSFKEWIKASLMIFVLIGFISFAESFYAKDLKIAHLGHLLGTVGGLLVCRFFKQDKL